MKSCSFEYTHCNKCTSGPETIKCNAWGVMRPCYIILSTGCKAWDSVTIPRFIVLLIGCSAWGSFWDRGWSSYRSVSTHEIVKRVHGWSPYRLVAKHEIVTQVRDWLPRLCWEVESKLHYFLFLFHQTFLHSCAP